jgi:hypothetical protein
MPGLPMECTAATSRTLCRTHLGSNHTVPSATMSSWPCRRVAEATPRCQGHRHEPSSMKPRGLSRLKGAMR